MKNNLTTIKNKIETYLSRGALLTAVIATTYVATEYQDVSNLSHGKEKGRAKNNISTIVSGIVGQKLYGDSKMELEAYKTFWPNTKISGATTISDINTYEGAFFTPSKFSANNSSGALEGTVFKTGFEWKVKQINDSIYQIARNGQKFDSKLELKVANGEIKGKFIGEKPSVNWKIMGKYDPDGRTNIYIECPSNLGVNLYGKITKK